MRKKNGSNNSNLWAKKTMIAEQIIFSFFLYKSFNQLRGALFCRVDTKIYMIFSDFKYQNKKKTFTHLESIPLEKEFWNKKKKKKIIEQVFSLNIDYGYDIQSHRKDLLWLDPCQSIIISSHLQDHPPRPTAYDNNLCCPIVIHHIIISNGRTHRLLEKDTAHSSNENMCCRQVNTQSVRKQRK